VGRGVACVKSKCPKIIFSKSLPQQNPKRAKIKGKYELGKVSKGKGELGKDFWKW